MVIQPRALSLNYSFSASYSNIGLWARSNESIFGFVCISIAFLSFFFVFAGAHVVRPKKGKAVWALHGGWRKNEVKLYTIHYDVYTFPIKLLLMTTIAHCNRQGMVRGWKIVSDDRIKLKSETFSAGLCWEWCILFFCCCWAGTHTHTPWKTYMFI